MFSRTTWTGPFAATLSLHIRDAQLIDIPVSSPSLLFNAVTAATSYFTVRADEQLASQYLHDWTWLQGPLNFVLNKVTFAAESGKPISTDMGLIIRSKSGRLLPCPSVYSAVSRDGIRSFPPDDEFSSNTLLPPLMATARSSSLTQSQYAETILHDNVHSDTTCLVSSCQRPFCMRLYHRLNLRNFRARVIRFMCPSRLHLDRKRG
ncbi:hypothetical protein C8J57DRAFT_1524169 [Mycena rebaudengoi]|nr:hypothetical protein C8J57DRAFT_1524169 [Mycena rebaudengoi]